MATPYGRSFFGDITSRLARLLDLSGTVPLELSPQISPVMLVGDATLPGMNDRAGRRWAARVNCVAQTSAYRATIGEAGVIVEGVYLRTDPTAVTTVDISIIGAEQVTGYGFGVTGFVLDSPTLDRPPVQLGAGAAFGARRVLMQWNNLPISTQLPFMPLAFYLAPGASFAITSSAGILEGMVYGRLF